VDFFFFLLRFRFLGEDGSGFSEAIGGAPVRLRIGREDVGVAEGIDDGV
jgi:hypothetical protein